MDSHVDLGLVSVRALLTSFGTQSAAGSRFVETMLRVIERLPSRETAWLALAMPNTLASNPTVLGSVAKVIVLESGDREGARVLFWEHCKVGAPLTIVTPASDIAWLEFINY